MGVARIINGTTDPMYVVTNANTSAEHSRTSGSADTDPDNGSAKCVYIWTRLEDSKIRVDHAHEQRRCLDPGVKEKSPSTLLIKAPAKSLRKTHQLR
eukprot:6865348-Lingulodinium_polyedra.AAC.1